MSLNYPYMYTVNCIFYFSTTIKLTNVPIIVLLSLIFLSAHVTEAFIDEGVCVFCVLFVFDGVYFVVVVVVVFATIVGPVVLVQGCGVVIVVGALVVVCVVQPCSFLVVVVVRCSLWCCSCCWPCGYRQSGVGCCRHTY